MSIMVGNHYHLYSIHTWTYVLTVLWEESVPQRYVTKRNQQLLVALSQCKIDLLSSLCQNFPTVLRKTTMIGVFNNKSN